MKYRTLTCFLFGFLFLYAGILQAAVIVRSNGDIITGRISSESEDEIVFSSLYGEITIKRSGIRKLIRDESEIAVESILTEDGAEKKVRLVFEDEKEKIYLTENGGTLRRMKERKTDQPDYTEHNFYLSTGYEFGYLFYDRTVFNTAQAKHNWASDGDFYRPGLYAGAGYVLNKHLTLTAEVFYSFLQANYYTAPPGGRVEVKQSFSFTGGAAGVTVSPFTSAQSPGLQPSFFITGGAAAVSSELQMKGITAENPFIFSAQKTVPILDAGLSLIYRINSRWAVGSEFGYRYFYIQTIFEPFEIQTAGAGLERDISENLFSEKFSAPYGFYGRISIRYYL